MAKVIMPFMPKTVVHLTEVEKIAPAYLQFGANPGRQNGFPAIAMNVKYFGTVKGVDMNLATYTCNYEIQSTEVTEDDVYHCYCHSVHSMKIALQFDGIGRSIPQEGLVCQGKEVYEPNLADLAKAANGFSDLIQ